ncbi:transcription factor Adf-1-like [Ostrinia nubilalis]|uniref:transcription factor Adf-1-like n=1 Tax=Ostrinia nubilalis TaxID=29057 RepID=UPI00308252E8
MNELDLIKEVEKRPILYDKSVSGFNKTKLRDDAWKEVQEALNVTEAECKKRWRSLRDSFIKLQRTHGGRTRWPYHHAMRFLLPHVEPKMENKEEESDTEDDPPMRFRCVPSMPSLPDLSFPSESNEEDQDSQPSPKKPRLNSTDEEGCHCNRNDPDELFLLSCAPILQRLSAKQNAGARLKIQQVLYEAEFGMQAELPYLTPAGEVIGVIQDLHEPVD